MRHKVTFNRNGKSINFDSNTSFQAFAVSSVADNDAANVPLLELRLKRSEIIFLKNEKKLMDISLLCMHFIVNARSSLSYFIDIESLYLSLWIFGTFCEFIFSTL